ncbi:glycoside hydrolase family 15 protein, partial [Candidatus Woesebacteria bacterium]|nr:glycoside hydrolase family 15 protein [Candidatus Woesebacteria bacterium]
MPRALTLGNGTFLVCLDKYGFVRDMYYPYVGLENHVAGNKHRIGFQINDTFSWLNDGSWDITIGYKPETMVGYLVCKNEALQVTVVMEDIVYNETDIFIRQVDVYNHSEGLMDIKVFFHQVFHISESKKRNTAFYDPTHNSVVHYKGRRVFIVNGRTTQGGAIDDYTVGAYEFDDKEGSFRDAEDGHLGKNAVEHGSVDSVVRFSAQCQPKEKARIFYWICAGHSLEQAYALNAIVMQKTPAAMLHSTEAFWHSWLKTNQFDTAILTKEQKKLFDTSLFILRCHTDNRGSIIASADSAMIEYGKDDYSYMWPRDAAFICSTLARAGFDEVTKPFFLFCKEVLHPDGYLHHRYRPDKSLGSTWHSTTSQKEWLKDKLLQLPIQEDETASVLFALWQHYQASKDLEFIESLYKPMIEKMAEFLVSFRDKETGLPLPSYDLWEEKIGVSTYTCSAVYAGLTAAAQFCELLDKRDRMRKYKQVAQEIKDAAIKYLFNEELDSFIRIAYNDSNGGVVQEKIVDASSLFGLWY